MEHEHRNRVDCHDKSLDTASSAAGHDAVAGSHKSNNTEKCICKEFFGSAGHTLTLHCSLSSPGGGMMGYWSSALNERESPENRYQVIM